LQLLSAPGEWQLGSPALRPADIGYAYRLRELAGVGHGNI